MPPGRLAHNTLFEHGTATATLLRDVLVEVTVALIRLDGTAHTPQEGFLFLETNIKVEKREMYHGVSFYHINKVFISFIAIKSHWDRP